MWRSVSSNIDIDFRVFKSYRKNIINDKVRPEEISNDKNG